MKTGLFAILPGLLILTSVSAPAQQILPSPLSPRVTRYQIKAELDPERKSVSGDMILDWRNPSRDTVKELQFHLYLNAFKNSKTTFLSQRRQYPGEESEWGYTDLEEIRIGGGGNLAGRLRYVQPDEEQVPQALQVRDEQPYLSDLYTKDQTVVVLPLEKPVLPDSSVKVRIHFTSKLPHITSRTGYSQNYFFVAQWFPKLGVYEPAGTRYAVKGGWNTHQYHPNSEFYANHSLYNVDLTVPGNYVVGSGGKLMAETVSNGKKTLTYRAEDIVDFAWTASEDFRIAEDQWKHVAIRVMLQPEHVYQAERHIRAAKYALEYLESHVGPYPWPHLTIVDPPTYGQGSGGMEYTTLITAGTFYMLPGQIRMAEMVTVHEFGHAYFMGILANNEFEEPWLDEGINSYWENRIMDWAYGEKTSMIGFPFCHIGDVEYARISWLGSSWPNLAPTSGNSWSFPRGTYGSSVYQKPATMLNTLERMIGQECMDKIFKRYYDQWAFRHPDSHDFIKVVNEVVSEVHGSRFGSDLNWFFDQFLFGTAAVDYAVSGIRQYPITEPGGFFDQNETKKYIKPARMENRYRSVVQLSRLGDGVIPVEIRIRFDSGEEILEQWDGKDKIHNLFYERADRVVSAAIDPGNKILLDSNLLNNSASVNPSPKPALKWTAKFLFLVENLIHSLSIFV